MTQIRPYSQPTCQRAAARVKAEELPRCGQRHISLVAGWGEKDAVRLTTWEERQRLSNCQPHRIDDANRRPVFVGYPNAPIRGQRQGTRPQPDRNLGELLPYVGSKNGDAILIRVDHPKAFAQRLVRSHQNVGRNRGRFGRQRVMNALDNALAHLLPAVINCAHLDQVDAGVGKGVGDGWLWAVGRSCCLITKAPLKGGPGAASKSHGVGDDAAGGLGCRRQGCQGERPRQGVEQIGEQLHFGQRQGAASRQLDAQITANAGEIDGNWRSDRQRKGQIAHARLRLCCRQGLGGKGRTSEQEV